MARNPPPGRPTAADAARRLAILRNVALVGFSVPPMAEMAEFLTESPKRERRRIEKGAAGWRDELRDGMRREGLLGCLTRWEKEFFRTTAIEMSLRQQLDAGWRLEAVQVLMWALAMIPELPPYDEQADSDLLKQLPSEGIAAFAEQATFRPQLEIDRARDLAEFWHWRSRMRELVGEKRPLNPTANLHAQGVESFDDIVRLAATAAHSSGDLENCIDDDFPAKGKAYRDLTDEEWSEVTSITTERHYALNWLCGQAPNNDWDAVPTDT